MTNQEYEFCKAMQERSTDTRTSLLTFSFTTVLAILGLALTANIYVNPITYLVPYCLIIPFQARISYYRLIHARVSAYMEEFCPEDVKFSILAVEVPEKQTGFFAVIARLVNYEMFILSCATAALFYFKYSFPTLQNFSGKDWIMLSLPVALSALVFAIITYAYNYGEWKKRYRAEWKKTLIKH